MKNALIGGLIVLLMSGLLVSCPEDDEDKGNSHNGLKVAEEYRGDWWMASSTGQPMELSFQLTSSEFIGWDNNNGEPSKTRRYPAWTVENDGVVELWFFIGTDIKYCTFTDSSTFVSPSGTTYVKK